MSNFTCPDCGRQWAKAYCADCAHEIGGDSAAEDLTIDGDVIRGSWSTCAAKIRVNPLRHFWLRSETRPLVQLWMVLAGGTVGAFSMRWWIFGALLLMLFLPLSWLLFWIYRRVSEIFYSASLTAGMVVSQEPLEMISVANMDTGSGEPAYAVKRVAIDRFPIHPAVVGTEFPCVSGFQEGPAWRRWGDFDPQPLSFGTGNRRVIQQRREKLGEGSFVRLRAIYERGLYPPKAGELLWIDESQSREDPPPLPTPPPPLPSRNS